MGIQWCARHSSECNSTPHIRFVCNYCRNYCSFWSSGCLREQICTNQTPKYQFFHSIPRRIQTPVFAFTFDFVYLLVLVYRSPFLQGCRTFAVRGLRIYRSSISNRNFTANVTSSTSCSPDSSLSCSHFDRLAKIHTIMVAVYRAQLYGAHRKLNHIAHAMWIINGESESKQKMIRNDMVLFIICQIVCLMFMFGHGTQPSSAKQRKRQMVFASIRNRYFVLSAPQSVGMHRA